MYVGKDVDSQGKKGGSFHKVLSSLWRTFAEYILNTSYELSCI